jgi:lysophospholipase L1-like esterase
MAPDLLISSLGTNETQQPIYDLSAAVEQQRHFWRVLRSAAPKAALLVVSPPDAKWGRHASKRLDGFVKALRAAALEEGAAFLDLRAAQGGKGAYERWAAAGLAGKDGVHYKNAGYRLWGQWLLEALQTSSEAPRVP